MDSPKHNSPSRPPPQCDIRGAAGERPRPQRVQAFKGILSLVVPRGDRKFSPLSTPDVTVATVPATSLWATGVFERLK